MQKTTQEILEKGITAHQDGDLEQADACYTSVLKIEPNHPDANHNMGVLAVHLGKTELALPFFKLALETNPKIDQFWISFIDTLIRLRNFDAAKEAVISAEERGIAGHKLGLLKGKLQDAIEAGTVNLNSSGAFDIWAAQNSKAGNQHLSIGEAECKKIPNRDDEVWLRPTLSDVARVREFLGNIYYTNSYLHQAMIRAKPTILIDIGANIGLSSLSLVKEFPTIRKVIAVEAEEKNFGVLSANFDLWGSKYDHVNWECINAVASNSESEKLVKADSLHELKSGHSASGTFRFVTRDYEPNSTHSFEKALSIQKLVSTISEKDKLIVKVDIEGGEEHLFKTNVTWLRRCHFLTCEVHDVFHPTMFNSSTNMIKALVDHNFAFVPTNNTLHCYNRNLIKLDHE